MHGYQISAWVSVLNRVTGTLICSVCKLCSSLAIGGQPRSATSLPRWPVIACSLSRSFPSCFSKRTQYGSLLNMKQSRGSL
ncbi:hypothetical protein DFP72DRAFT_260836 [Ephemerocybe angulata]|uniref:Secreted protein n=1 Tax=Ephemerocybe angulata TaxID=980116 RepID=A0A8H6MA93_9AGAR|nr:hypothetical protein DFP72DRAFT_260836 [Tulosesus angulatus]